MQFLILSGGKDESDKQVDYIIILGGRVYGEKPSRSLNERIIAATKYLKEHKDIMVIASGGTGKGEEISEEEKSTIIATGKYAITSIAMYIIEFDILKNHPDILADYYKRLRIPGAEKYSREMKKLYKTVFN